MASPSPEPREDGYATAAAALIALALGMVAAATVGMGVSDLRLARRDLQRTKIEYALASAHAGAVGPLLTRTGAARLEWRAESAVGPVVVLAEAESAKLSLAEAGGLDEQALGRFGVADLGRLKARLTQAGEGAPTALSIGDLDAAPLWRACAGSMISPYGRGRLLTLPPARPPETGSGAALPGSIWRVRIVTATGWAEDRVLRLTGDEHHPSAVIERRVSRVKTGSEPCAALIS